MFEIIESHESQQIRDLVIEQMTLNYPDDKKQEIVELWITHPIPQMENFILKIIQDEHASLPIKVAANLMLDDIQTLQELDPDLYIIDSYIDSIDPMLGSLLIQKTEKLKKDHVHYQRKIREQNEDEVTINDRIRRKDFSYIWNNILEYPLPFIIEFLQIIDSEDWLPVDESDRNLIDILTEHFGNKGWNSIEYVIWVAVYKKISGKLMKLEQSDIERRTFEIDLNKDLIFRPDRIIKQKFESRGRFNLTHADLNLNLYQESIRYSEFDGLLHIPIYSNNGVELLEFTFPAKSEKNFAIDDEGLYFSIKNKEGIYTVNLIELSALLQPISQHSEMVNRVIPTLTKNCNQNQLMILSGLNIISNLHRGREFGLWDLKSISNFPKDLLSHTSKACSCILSIDVGDTSTKVYYLSDDSCQLKSQQWQIPTIIYYDSVSVYKIGDDVISNDLAATSQTFNFIKSSLKNPILKQLRIQNSIITPHLAYEHFLHSVIDLVIKETKHQIPTLCLAIPTNISSNFESWIRNSLSHYLFDEIFLTDEISATINAIHCVTNQRENTLVIDIGGSQMLSSIAKLDGPKNKKKSEDARLKDIHDTSPVIISKSNLDKGSQDINKLLFEIISSRIEFKNSHNDIDISKIELSENLSITLNGKKNSIDISFDPTTDIDMNSQFKKSELFKSFQLLLRNVMAKGQERGLTKKELANVILVGKGSSWPPFLEYIHGIFKEQDIILEKDPFITTKGLISAYQSQSLSYINEEDILLQIASNGITDFETIISRGDNLINSSKKFEIRPNGTLSSISIDCWKRRPEFTNDETIQPLKDSEQLIHNDLSYQLFRYERIYREQIKIEIDSILEVMISPHGKLCFKISSESHSQLILTDYSLY